MPKLGEPIFLNLQVWDGQPGLYVIAHLLDQDGNELPGSPLDLPHLGYGLYANYSIRMPFTREVKAVYKVFLDPGHTVFSPYHSDAIDSFPLETGSQLPDLTGELEGAVNLLGAIEPTLNLGGLIFSEIALSGEIEQDINLTGTVELDTELSGSTTQDSETGIIEC